MIFRIREDLITVAYLEPSTNPLDRGLTFKNRAVNFSVQFSQINVVTVALQKQKATLSECRFFMDELIQAVQESRNDRDSTLYQCQLGDN